jgi:hypothetical protein
MIYYSIAAGGLDLLLSTNKTAYVGAHAMHCFGPVEGHSSPIFVPSETYGEAKITNMHTVRLYTAMEASRA